MAELIIKNKFDRRSRTSIVINIETEKRSEIEKLSLASGHSFNEIVEMLIDFALPLCKLADDADKKLKEEAEVKPLQKSAIKANSEVKLASKTEVKPVGSKTEVKSATPKSKEDAKRTAVVKSETKTTATKPEPVRPAPAIRSKSSDPHSSVPTFKIPPLTVTKTTVTNGKK